MDNEQGCGRSALCHFLEAVALSAILDQGFVLGNKVKIKDIVRGNDVALEEVTRLWGEVMIHTKVIISPVRVQVNKILKLNFPLMVSNPNGEENILCEVQDRNTIWHSKGLRIVR